MKAGKISESQLKRSVLKQLHTNEESLLAGIGVGSDFAALSVENNSNIILSTHSVTETADNAGTLGVVAALNAVAVSGARPVGVIVEVLLPTTGNEAQLRELMKQLDVAAHDNNAQVLRAHAKVTRAVKEIVVTITGVGCGQKEKLITSSSVEPGMDILVSKWIALEGTYLLATEREEELMTRYAVPFIDKAKKYEAMLSVQSEAAVAAKAGVAAMHAVEEDGIYGALWEMAEASGVGLEIDLKKIPIRQETIEISEFFDLNPYKMDGRGCILMAAKDGNHVVREIAKAGGVATIIGKATDNNDRVLLYEEERRFLERN